MNNYLKVRLEALEERIKPLPEEKVGVEIHPQCEAEINKPDYKWPDEKT